jgi:hypothetical protein
MSLWQQKQLEQGMTGCESGHGVNRLPVYPLRV